MADLFGKALGNDGIARAVGEQAGKVVEGAVKKAMGGNKQQQGEQKKEGRGGGGEGGGGGGFSVGDVLNLAGGNKNEGEGGAGGGMGSALGGSLSRKPEVQILLQPPQTSVCSRLI